MGGCADRRLYGIRLEACQNVGQGHHLAQGSIELVDHGCGCTRRRRDGKVIQHVDAGKTTTTAKLAKYLIEKRRKKVLTVSGDVYRPAAIEQLKLVTAQAGAEWFPSSADQKPVAIALAAIAIAVAIALAAIAIARRPFNACSMTEEAFGPCARASRLGY